METPRVRVFQVEGMDCADCARRVEEAARSLPGVREAQANFASGKLYVVLERPNEGALKGVLEPMGYRLKPEEALRETSLGPWRAALLTGGLLLLAFLLSRFHASWGPWGYGLAALFGVFPLARQAWALRKRNPFSIQALVTLATLGALFLGAWAEAAVVVFLFLLGEVLEAYATSRARQGLWALGTLLPKRAWRRREGGLEEVPLSALDVGDLVQVPQGERIPADGVVREGQAEVEAMAFTGEPWPEPKAPGDRVYGGSLVVQGSLLVEVEKLPWAGFLAEVEGLAEKALLAKTRLERFMDAFSRRYTPLVLLFALVWGLLVPLFRGDFLTHLYQALALLLIACPCALVVSVPLAVAAGIARGARLGILFKEGGALERLGRVRYVALDKTGTLTLGRPKLSRLAAFGLSQEEALALAAAVEMGSGHPLARAVKEAAKGLSWPKPEASWVEPGVGAWARIGGRKVGLLRPEAYPLSGEVAALVEAWEEEGLTLALLWEEGRPLALLGFQDEPRPEARGVVQALRRLGLKPLLLTGDRKGAASGLAQALGLSPQEVRAGLSPREKLQAVAELEKRGGVAMVGDGVNDAPALAQARVGIAVLEGTEVASRAADVGLWDLRVLPSAFALSRLTLGVLAENIALALGIKLLVFATTLLGLTGLWAAVLSDTGALLLVSLNSLRLLWFRR